MLKKIVDKFTGFELRNFLTYAHIRKCFSSSYFVKTTLRFNIKMFNNLQICNSTGLWTFSMRGAYVTCSYCQDLVLDRKPHMLLIIVNDS